VLRSTWIYVSVILILILYSVCETELYAWRQSLWDTNNRNLLGPSTGDPSNLLIDSEQCWFFLFIHTNQFLWAIHLNGPFICMGHLAHTFADTDRVDYIWYTVTTRSVNESDDWKYKIYQKSWCDQDTHQNHPDYLVVCVQGRSAYHATITLKITLSKLSSDGFSTKPWWRGRFEGPFAWIYLHTDTLTWAL